MTCTCMQGVFLEYEACLLRIRGMLPLVKKTRSTIPAWVELWELMSGWIERGAAYGIAEGETIAAVKKQLGVT